MTARVADLSRLVLAGLLGALAASGCTKSDATGPAAEPKAPPAVAVSTVAAEERALPRVLDVTGTLMADAQTDVAAEVGGRVIRAPVERGTVVEAGAVLASLDAADATAQLREAEALEGQTRERLGLTPDGAFDAASTPEARQARVAMERTEAEHQRYLRLVEQGMVSRSDYETRRAEQLAAREQYSLVLNQTRQLYQGLLAQRARVALARKALADTVIRAPFDAVVAQRHASVGDFLPKGGRVATLMRVDPLRVELTVPEAAVPAIRRGQRVTFTVQAYPDRAFAGTVAYVGPALRTEARALVVEAVLPNPDARLQPGLFATARLELPVSERSVFAPARAVRTEAGVSSLFVVRGGKAELRFVQVGRQAGDLVEVLRGLRPGEAVVTDPVAGLADGGAVTVAGRER
jgi:RND family efflux transporter MFP subunit